MGHFFLFLLFPFRLYNPLNTMNLKPYVRAVHGDRHIPLRCFNDIQCPRGTRCYVPKKPKGLDGVCVVTYDSQLMKGVDPEIW